jgi:hypothetical protein
MMTDKNSQIIESAMKHYDTLLRVGTMGINESVYTPKELELITEGIQLMQEKTADNGSSDEMYEHELLRKRDCFAMEVFKSYARNKLDKLNEFTERNTFVATYLNSNNYLSQN